MNLTLPSASVVIPTYRRPEALERTLRSLAALSHEGQYEIVVVDDGSADLTSTVVEGFRQEHPHLEVRFCEQENSGAARARNRGANESRFDVIVFLDDDMLVEPDHLERHLAHFVDRDKKRLVNGHWEFAPEVRRELEQSPFGRFRLWIETWIKSGLELEPIDANLLKPNLVTACNLGIRRQDFLDLGGFDESFPAAGYEDQDFAVRARHVGFDFIYDKRIVLAHMDQRTNLNAFSKRIRQGALTAAIMARKYPSEFGARPLIYENAPISKGDGPRLIIKKLLKVAAASGLGRAAMRSIILILEQIAPNGRLMRSAYWKWCGIWIHLGVREGLRLGPNE